MPIRSRTSDIVPAAIARAFSAPASSVSSSAAVSARSSCVALAHRRQELDHGLGGGAP